MIDSSAWELPSRMKSWSLHPAAELYSRVGRIPILYLTESLGSVHSTLRLELAVSYIVSMFEKESFIALTVRPY